MLQIRTLGGLSVQSDSRTFAGAATQPRRLAVLALIATAGERGITREKLLTLLWPDTDEEQGRRALTQGLYALRKDLGADELFLGVQELRLNPELATCDTVEFERALRAGELARAAALYQGPFLDGFRLPGAAEFERWADDERLELQHRYAGALERLARAATERGEAREAVGWWRKLAALDPLNARTAVELMHALVAAGDRNAALQHARIYEALMEQELDLPPDQEVVEVAERIRSAPPPPRPAPAVSPPVATPAAPVTVSTPVVAPPAAPPMAEPSEENSPAVAEVFPAVAAAAAEEPAPAATATAEPTDPPMVVAQPAPASVSPPDVAPAPAAAAPDGPTTSAASEIPVGSAEPAAPAAETGASGPATGTVAAPRGARGRRQRGRVLRRRASLAGLVALTVLGAVATGAWIFAGRVGGLVAAGVLQPDDRLVLADFASLSGDSLLAEIATEALRVDLSQSRLFALLEPLQVRGVLQRMQRPPDARLDAELAREVALREGVKAVILGEVGRAGTGYLFAARLVSAESGQVLTAVRETARDSAAILDAIDRLSRQLRSRVGESFRQLRSTEPLLEATTASLDALRLHTQARRAILRDGDYPRAISLLEEAVAIDTGFASAYYVLATALGNVGGDPTRRMDALTRAFSRRDRLTERERNAVASQYYRAIGDTERAAAAFLALLERNPHDSGVLNNLGTLTASRRDFARAEEFYRRAIAVDSLGNNIPYMNLQRVLVNQGRIDEARVVIGLMEERFPGAPTIPIAQASLEAAAGNYAAAEGHARAFREARRDAAVWRVGTDRMLAYLLALQGRLAEAEEFLRDAAATTEARGDLTNHLLTTLELAMLDAVVRGDPRRGTARVDALLARDPVADGGAAGRPYLPLALFYALAEQPGRARTFLDAYERSEPAEQQRGAQRAVNLVRGAIALAEQRPEEAVGRFRAADVSDCTICVLPLLGLAHERAGRPDSAIAAYERYLDGSWVDRAAPWPTGLWDASGDGFWRARVLLRLAALHEARGNRAQAAKHYGALADLWKGADAELQPRVAEVRTHLGRVASREAGPVREPGPSR